MEGNAKICIGIQSQLILILSNYRKCMEKSRISKNLSWTSLHYRYSVLFLWTRKLLFSKRTWQIYMNSGRISWLWIPIQIFEFPAILPWLPMMQLWAWTPLFNNSYGWKYHGTSNWMRKPQWTIKTYERSLLLRPFWSTHENINMSKLTLSSHSRGTCKHQAVVHIAWTSKIEAAGDWS